jgi:hypothetical protein
LLKIPLWGLHSAITGSLIHHEKPRICPVEVFRIRQVLTLVHVRFTVRSQEQKFVAITENLRLLRRQIFIILRNLKRLISKVCYVISAGLNVRLMRHKFIVILAGVLNDLMSSISLRMRYIDSGDLSASGIHQKRLSISLLRD